MSERGGDTDATTPPPIDGAVAGFPAAAMWVADSPPVANGLLIDGMAARPRAIVTGSTDPADTVAPSAPSAPDGRTGSDPRATAARQDRVRVVVGVGLRPGTDAETITRAIDAVVGAAAVSVIGLATIDRRADEAGLRSTADVLGVPVIACRAEELAEVDTPHRSPRAVRAVGTPSVAEAAALLVGRGELVCGRTVVGGVVVALATVTGDRN
ncbi:cobalamin biosynthesis protein [Nocardia asteroides]|uniref:cobalamin biosynthesis protein n=1 Tax=Nocardia asteroides TaxID=1824 RepID=UPI0037C72A95